MSRSVEASPSASASPSVEASSTADPRPSRPRRNGRLTHYLERPVRPGPHHVDHGVLQAAVAGGWPHLYRLELSLGLLDHLTLGATAHWLPQERAPRISPVVAVAFFRNHLFETGVRYFGSLYPPPVQDFDPTTPSFQRSAQWLLAHGSFGQAWVTGGFDAGVVRARDRDPGQDPDARGNNPSIIRWRFGGGLHLRVGTRRWGFTAQVLVPHLLAELRLDLRFGLFERRAKGGWRPSGIAEDWDRPAPW
ncbi:MAG: hypothetical protein KDK70_18910 [Myxococcales bacterium]|nr:hypothetical protein [Myxococcales bacterium]